RSRPAGRRPAAAERAGPSSNAAADASSQGLPFRHLAQRRDVLDELAVRELVAQPIESLLRLLGLAHPLAGAPEVVQPLVHRPLLGVGLNQVLEALDRRQRRAIAQVEVADLELVLR